MEDVDYIERRYERKLKANAFTEDMALWRWMGWEKVKIKKVIYMLAKTYMGSRKGREDYKFNTVLRNVFVSNVPLPWH